MMYLGGKTKIAKRLASFLSLHLTDGDVYIEPFFGSGAVALELLKLRDVSVVGSDANRDLILLFEGLQHGVSLPERIGEDEYRRLRAEPSSFRRSFAGFGLSFGGKFFGGYARNRRGDDYYGQICRSLEIRRKAFAEVQFECCQYNGVGIHDGAVVYCDPPYQDSTGYKTGKFDHAKFWQWVRETSKRATVFVSEYAAPEDFCCVAEFPKTTALRQKNGANVRIEKVFRYES